MLIIPHEPEELVLPLAHHRVTGRWESEVVIPWSFVPTTLIALNAFQIARGHFHAYGPLPGEQVDFHQPQAFPAASLGI